MCSSIAWHLTRFTRLNLTRLEAPQPHSHAHRCSPRRTALQPPSYSSLVPRLPSLQISTSPPGLTFGPLDRLQISTVASGALDRLQSEQDACVRYDGERKLWIYLHGNRALDSFGPPAKQA